MVGGDVQCGDEAGDGCRSEGMGQGVNEGSRLEDGGLGQQRGLENGAMRGVKVFGEIGERSEGREDVCACVIKVEEKVMG